MRRYNSLAKFSEQGLDALTAEETVRLQALLGPFFHGIDSLFRLYEKGLVDPENWENIVEIQFDVWWSNPHMIAYICSRPGPISKRFATYIGSRLAEQGHAA